MDKSATFPGTFEGLLELVGRLRGPGGCPWDREQTRESLKELMLEECYELVEAIENGEVAEIADEIGDVCGHMAFQIALGDESDDFTAEDVFGHAIDKLVRRHPHVFGDAEVPDEAGLWKQWDRLKKAEREEDPGLLGGDVRAQPALARAQSLQRRAARAGFEPEGADSAPSTQGREGELGDAMFSLVHTARREGVDAEAALRHANERFTAGFRAMERLCEQRGLDFESLAADELDALWLEANGA